MLAKLLAKLYNLLAVLRPFPALLSLLRMISRFRM